MANKAFNEGSHVRFYGESDALARSRRMSWICKTAAMLLAAVASGFSVLAEQVSSDMVVKAVNTMIAQGGQMESPIKGAVSSVRLCTTKTGVTFYVAKLKEGGFVVTSADTEIDPIIAFSTASDIVEDPRNPLWAMLESDMAARQKSLGSKSKSRVRLTSDGNSGGASASPAAARWAQLTSSKVRLQHDGAGAVEKYVVATSGKTKISDVRVAPLLKTKWGQDKAGGSKCFNYYTPKNYVCGCTATAGAQILRYHAFPKEAVEPMTYDCAIDGRYVELTQKGGVYEWSKMPYVPGKGTTDAQRKAIGKLTYDVGVAVHSEYSRRETWGYGADFIDLCYEWGYAHATTFWYRSFHSYAWGEGEGFTEDELKSVLIPNLDAKLPVGVRIYNIYYEDDLAHFVVADGYGYMWDESLFCVHLNFGWSGNSDAWYVLPDFNAGHNWYTTINYLYGNIYPEGPETGGIVSGRVLSSATSKPASGIVVTARNSDGDVKYATTDANGIYSFILPGSGGMAWDEDKWPDDDWDDDDWDYDYDGGNNEESEETPIDWEISIENAWPEYESESQRSYSRGIRDSENHYGLDFSVDIYTVTFDPNGGSGDVSRREGNVVGELPQTTRRGYTLKGWYTAKSGGTEVTASTWPSEDMTCYAQWVPIGYTVSFDANGGSGYMAPMEFLYDEAQMLSQNEFSKAGAVFQGWSLSPSKIVSFADGESVMNLLAAPGTVTLYAVWVDENVVVANVGTYFKKTLAELGYDVPTDGNTPYSVVAKGLPAGLALKSNAAVKDKKGKIVRKAKCEWWIEGVPTAALDFFTNPPYLVITLDGETSTEPLVLESLQKVTELGELALGKSINTNGWLVGVGAGWSVTGLPPGLSFATKKVTKKSGKTTITVAEAYSVYGKTTKAGLFTITAKKKIGAYYETKKFRVLVTPSAVDTSRFGEGLMDMATMAYVPFEWNLANDVSAVGGNVAKVTGLPTGLAFKGQMIKGMPTEAGTYVVTFTKNIKEGTKTVAKTAQILWKVVPSDAELELGFNTSGGVIESGSVGLNYGDLLVFNATEGAKVTASGLPAGIALADCGDGKWGFTGFTVKAGTYLVTVKATLNGKTVTQRVALKVDGLPIWAKGTYDGYVSTDGDGYSGLATITVSSAGKISGKFAELGTNWTFSAASFTARSATADYDDAFICSNVVAKYAYKDTEKDKNGKKRTVTKYLTRTFGLAVAEKDVLNPVRGFAQMSEADGSSLNAYQNPWGWTEYKAIGKKLFYTSKKNPYRTYAMDIYTNDVGEVSFTQNGADVDKLGFAYFAALSLKVTPNGAVTATISYDTGKKDKKTKKTVYYKPTCSTVVIPTSAADAEPFTGEVLLYFVPSESGNFPGFAAVVPL